MSTQDKPIFQAIKQLLEVHSVDFREVEHGVTKTSEESAKARGEDISIGGKAILAKIDDEFRLFVFSAALKLNSKKLKQQFKAKRIRFANSEELLERTGLVPGSVPPFGRPILELELFVDVSITKNEKIAFNAGSLTNSIVMNTSDYLTLAKPQVMDFAD